MKTADHPDVIRGRAAAEAVKAAGGDVMEQSLEFIRVCFDEQSRRQRLARLAERPMARMAAERTVRAQWGDYL